MNLSMIKYFFDIRSKEETKNLFKGLKIENEKIYEIEPQRLKLLGLPPEFDGFLSVKMHGTPNAPNCFFSLQFADSDGKTQSYVLGI